MSSKARRSSSRRASFIMTISAAAVTSSCSSADTQTEAPTTEQIGGDPSDVPDATAETSPEERLDIAGFPTVVNAKDDQSRTVFSSGDGTCYIHLPFPALEPGQERQPGTAPPSVPTQCPTSMNDPAWKSCSGGTILTNEPADTCVCFVMGNPPYPPRRTPCPTK